MQLMSRIERITLKRQEINSLIKISIKNLQQIVKAVLQKVGDKSDISDGTLNHFLVNNPKLRSFYLLPKTDKRL